MIRSLRKKFILITMVSVLILLIFVLGIINVVNICQANRETSGILNYLTENALEFERDDRMEEEGMERKEKIEFDDKREPYYEEEFKDIPRKNPAFDRNPEILYTIRYFAVDLNAQGDIVKNDMEHIAAVGKEEVEQYAKDVLSLGKTKGLLGIYKYQVTEKEDGKRIIFLDCNDKIHSCTAVFLTSLIVGMVSYLFLLFIITAFSRKAVEPVIQNIERQKQFVSDAGHELKTPLAIISANADVLSLTTPENEWVTSIKNQTRRMDALIKELLTLNRMEEKKENILLERISLTEIANEMVSSFEVLAKEKQKDLKWEIEENLYIKGDKQEIRNLFSVLLDNAVKYSLPESEIIVKSWREKEKVRIQVKNQCEPIKEGNLNNIFERFYRLDSSRSRETGGFGIGLAIAKESVKLHKGKISVDYKEKEGICFSVVIPQDLSEDFK